MDDLDRKLVALLRQDARLPAAVLAARLRVSRGTVQNRIARMLERGDIHGFTVRTRAEAAHAVRAIMCVAVEGERTAAVVRALRGAPQVQAIHSTNGRWDLVCELEADSLAEFSRTLDVVREIPGIAASETSLLLETHKL
jgi:DNA-binding Lrp family transcriptional regulator